MRLLAAVVLVTACASSPPARRSIAPTPMSDGDHVIDVGGVTLAYHVHGKGPICIAHPGGPGQSWTYLRMREVENSLRIVYLEPVGTGGSSSLHDSNAYTMARYVELLDGFRAALGLDKPCVLGHSHGGKVALHWAVAHPDHVGALILYATAAKSGGDPAAAEAAMKAFANEPWFANANAADEDAAISNAELDQIIDVEMPLAFADWTHHEDEYRAAVAGVHTYLEPFKAPRAPFDLRTQLATIHAPTLVIAGAHDWRASPARTAELVEGIAGATLVMLPNSSHVGHVEEPAAFAAAIREFAVRIR